MGVVGALLPLFHRRLRVSLAAPRVIPAEDAERLYAGRGETPTRLHLLPGDHDLSRHIEAELPELLAFLQAALAERAGEPA
ncbi:hypothetical protein Q671_00490 [Halomonas sp. PBN3]|nr:hypothetical protein Q671_00490 [Halomonas sp. PBN3]